MVQATRPKVVVCLGAGVLNDIPYSTLVESGATIHLVDWLPGAIDWGLGQSLIRRGNGGSPDCVYCHLNEACAKVYCRQFLGAVAPGRGVCDQFVPKPDEPFVCVAFERGEQPIIHERDVTAGYASAFGEGVLKVLRDVGSWRQALRQARALAKRVGRYRDSLDIPDASTDLVISSMLVSQFEHEPYEYFSRQAATLLGAPTPQEERYLRTALDKLRSTLLTNQISRHCDEIHRMLAPGGRCFVSFELFRLDPHLGRWFLVKEMHKVLELLARRFDFNLDVVPEPDSLTRFQSGDGASAVLSLVLEPVTR